MPPLPFLSAVHEKKIRALMATSGGHVPPRPPLGPALFIACVFAHRKSAVIVDFAEARIATLKRKNNQFLSVCVYVKKFANGINYIEDSGNEI